ncbi:MAG TPA: hypothetical protein VNJ08_10090 [Bacteriovoracaceae bacterium]|nr:hypothetical protein [Bacteriovoracaceae bacterium]
MTVFKIMLLAFFVLINVNANAQYYPPQDTMRAVDSQVLYPGSALFSRYGTFGLHMQDDCNLVVYRGRPHVRNAVWSSNTHNKGYGCYAEMQVDGNLVVYNQNHKALFATGTHRYPRAVLVMQEDGNLVIYSDASRRRAVWDSF